MKKAKPRAAVILLQEGKIALLERNRRGTRYLVFPGGGIAEYETVEQAAAREAEEELGLQVQVGRLVAEIWFNGQPQYYFLAEVTGGEFGAGHGKEIHSPAESDRGSYKPVWLPVEQLTSQPVLPSLLAYHILKATRQGWPDQPLIQRDAQEG